MLSALPASSHGTASSSMANSNQEDLLTASHHSSSMMQLSDAELGRMALKAKQQRLKAEQDLQLLQNRINRLVIEQERAGKRVAETRRRTEEILNLKQRNSAQHAAKQDASHWMSAERDMQRSLFQEARLQRKNGVALSRHMVHRLKQDEVHRIRQLARENEEAVATRRAQEVERAMEQKRQVIQMQRAAAERKQKERDATRARVRNQREQARQALGDDCVDAENTTLSLAEEERRLVESIAEWNRAREEAEAKVSSTVNGDVSMALNSGPRVGARSATYPGAPLASIGGSSLPH